MLTNRDGPEKNKTGDLNLTYLFAFAGMPDRLLLVRNDRPCNQLTVYIGQGTALLPLAVKVVFRYPRATRRGSTDVETASERIYWPAAKADPERHFPYYGAARLTRLNPRQYRIEDQPDGTVTVTER